MTPAAHTLSDPQRFAPGIYTARCACGWSIYDTSLPRVWALHDVHLSIVRATSEATHPSRWRKDGAA
jgi:hypothetical protein